MRTWPYIAKDQHGKRYTPLQAKLSLDKTFTIQDIEVTPCVGEQNKPHWKSTNGSYYKRDFDHDSYEMTEWHHEMQVGACDQGLLIEEPIVCVKAKLYYVADAYDPKTNTVYEYVHSNFNKQKVNDYALMGLNQKWIFNSMCTAKLKNHLNYCRRAYYALEVVNKITKKELSIWSEYR